MERYKLIDHTADIGIIAFGKDFPELFANAAYAMFDILTDANMIEDKTSFSLQVSANDIEGLIRKWLDELLYHYETERIICNRFEINIIDDRNLDATVFGEKIDRKRHEIKAEIKNVTYHQLKIRKTKKGLTAQIIFDV